ncbi:MAG: PAS domain S-box protein [Chloroflexi bacterium]|nr:PAS domain S-box protein [Chloroflexota bacterium]
MLRTPTLSDSEATFAAIFNSSPNSTILVGRDYRVKAINRQASEMTWLVWGHTLEVGEDLQALSKIFNIPKFEENFEEALAGKLVSLERSYKFGTEEGWFQFNYIPVTHDSGEVLAVCLSVVDILEHKRAETILKRYRLLSENTLDAILFIRSDGSILEANQAAALTYGYSLEELQSLNIHDLRLPGTLTLVSTQMQQAYTSGTMFETYHHRKNGTIFPVEISSRGIDLENERVILSVIRDITERKRNEEALRESEERYRSVVNAMSEGIILQNVDGTVLASNPSATQILGFPDADLTGHNPISSRWEAIHEDGTPFPIETQPAMRTLHTGKPCSGVVMGIERPNAPTRWISINTEPLFQPDKITMRGVVSSFVDITTQRLAEEALQYRFRIEELIAGISTNFINVAAGEIDKEINQALAAIGHFSEVDHSYIFLFSEDSSLLSNSYEWCKEGIAPQTQLLKHLSVASFPWIRNQIQQLETLYFPSLDLIPPEANSEREALEAQSVQSLLLVPLVYERKPVGFLGFDAVKAPKNWTSDNIALLRIVGEIFISAIRRKNTEQSLVEQRDFAQLAMNTLGQGLTVTNPENQFQFVNPAFARMVGYSPEELVGKRPEDFISPDYKFVYTDAFQRRLRGETTTHENQLVHRNGNPFYVTVTGVPLFRENQFKGVISVLTDITARKQAEEALSESEHRLRTVVSNVPLMLFALDNRGVITFAEGRGFQDLAVEPAKLVGRSLPTAHPAITDKLHRTLEGEFVNTLLTLDGKVYEFWLSPVKEESNSERVSGVIGVAIDVSERLRAAEDIRQAFEKEKELSNLKSSFISMASHEFRTPLTTIYSSAELLENYGHRWDNERKQKIYQRIYISVKNITDLLDEILFISKSEAGKLEFNPAPFDLSDFCGGLIEELQLGLGSNHHFKLNLLSAPSRVWADERLLRKALTHLLTNAIKYSSPSSTVYFELSYQAGAAVIVIRDEGIGIPEEGMNHLFEVFYRAKNVGDIKGTGLGLAIVKKTLDAYGGRIKIESKVNTGTTCTLTIPLVQAADKAANNSMPLF